MSHPQPLIGVIGGTGVYAMEGLTDIDKVEVQTPYGPPSGPVTLGTVEGIRCAFLARHGHGHGRLPSEINYRANIYALKKLGVKYLFAVSACGSLRGEMAPLDLVVVDQFIDRTKGVRDSTFFGEGIVAHVQFGHPVCERMQKVLHAAITSSLPTIKVHTKGTYVCMEGPAFSTKAESNLYRSWGADLIGMTALTEAKLAREAEMAFGLVGLVTDYDCWHEEEAHVSAASVIQILKKNGENVQIFIKEAIRLLAQDYFDSDAHNALSCSIMTPAAEIPEQKRKDLAPILGKYISAVPQAIV